MYRVLLVDDEVLVREAISENIRWNELGYVLAGNCQNGKEAIEFLEKNPVDVVLTDICMPYVDGIELSEFIYNHFKNINIIIFSGYDDFDYAKKAIKYNVEEYLLKPVTASELSKVLTDLKEKIDKKKQEAASYVKLYESYNKNKLLIKSKVIDDLLKGSKTKEENEKGLRENNITLDAFEYRVAIVLIDLASDKNKEDQGKQYSSLMTFAVYNICDEILQLNRSGLACLGNDNRVFILFKTNTPKAFSMEVKRICEEISSKIMQFMQLGVTISIGGKVNKQQDIPKSYEGAEYSLKYQYLFGENSIIDIEDINKEQDLKEDIILEVMIDSLILAIKLNNKVGIEDILKQIEAAIKGALPDKNESDLYLQQIIIAICNALKASELEEAVLYTLRNQIIAEVAAAKTLGKVMEVLKNYCYKAAGEIEIQKNIGGKKQALLAMDFIERNYADTELNLNTICSYLNISASRFSTIFKNTTGETFMEVLIRIRMQKAKELLENTDLKNYEIAEKVGFSDPHYFSIVFKKMTGKTPSEYAKEKRVVL
ncbi:response regulator [Anaerocolumna sp. AGMB13025]|uniref:response regulator transcription factor n=1 Tax=Anaerocolumna sp. AGMB13025 TaxID=3039116 RepID=UPI00241E6472|nr:response regulator [Anaerocolumna sp. AGMB13025]WFR58584.1 response regulator [Anaerocolumna sp. AGMB13025]